MQINLLEARTCLSRLVAAAECGEEVILARSGKPVAKIVPYEAPRVKPPGSMRGRIKVLPDRIVPRRMPMLPSCLKHRPGLTPLFCSGIDGWEPFCGSCLSQSVER